MPTGSHSERRGFPPHADDLLLVQRARGGESVAIERLLARLECVGRLLAFEVKRVGVQLSPEELGDATRSVLVSAWGQLGDYGGAGSLDAWLGRIAFLDLVEGLRREGRLPARSAGPLALVGGMSEEGQAAALQRERLDRTLDQLERQQADVLRLKHLEGRTFQAMSDWLETPVRTIKARYHQGLMEMRGLLCVESSGGAEGLHESQGHEALLPRLLADADDPRGMLAASELKGCAACARALEELQGLTQALDGLGDCERELLEGSRVRGVALPGPRVRAALAKELEPPAGPLVQRSSPIPLRWFVAAALAMATFGGIFAVESLGGSGEEESGASSAVRVEGRSPSGVVAAYDPFTWEYARPDGGWFRVVVYDGLTRELVLETGNVETNELQLTSEEEAELPAEILWNVRVYNGSSWIGYVEEAGARAQRR